MIEAEIFIDKSASRWVDVLRDLSFRMLLRLRERSKTLNCSILFWLPFQRQQAERQISDITLDIMNGD